MVELDDVRQGWDFMEKVLGASFGADIAHNEHLFNLDQNAKIEAENIIISEVNDAIEELSYNINNHTHKNLGVEQFKGYAAEEWHAATFNIDAIRNGSTHRAETLNLNTDGSVDIHTNYGKDYSLKYYNDTAKAENAQAALFKDGSGPKYQGQERLIAGEQVNEAKTIANRRYNKDLHNRPDVSASHKQTHDHLTGQISDGKSHSKELSIKESKQIAKEAKQGKFDPAKHGFEKSEMLEAYQTDYLSKAMQAGLTAAAITAITQIVPELYKSIDYLIKNGEIDLTQVAKSGQKIMSSSAESFLRGSIAFGIKAIIDNGLLGEAVQSISPPVIGTMVAICIGTIKNSILVAAGKMTPREMGMKFVDTVVVSAGYLVGMKIGGIIAQALIPELPGIAYAIGSLIGCSVAVLYNIGKRKLISFCVDTGFTCFGLVEQNYELPESVLKQLGIDTIRIDRTNIEQTQIDKTEVFTTIDEQRYETIDMTMLKRGVIGINKIGYVIR